MPEAIAIFLTPSLSPWVSSCSDEQLQGYFNHSSLKLLSHTSYVPVFHFPQLISYQITSGYSLNLLFPTLIPTAPTPRLVRMSLTPIWILPGSPTWPPCLQPSRPTTSCPPSRSDATCLVLSLSPCPQLLSSPQTLCSNLTGPLRVPRTLCTLLLPYLCWNPIPTFYLNSNHL